MAIKGLKRTGQTPGLARAGVIRLGYKARKCKCGRITEPLDNGPTCPACNATLPDTSFPREAGHFILVDAPDVAEALGTNAPTELRVYFPFDEVDRVFPSYMQLWATSALRCRGDGEHILYAINPITGRVTVKDGVVQEAFSEEKRDFEPGEVLACPGLDRNLYAKCANCKPNAMLIVMLRDVPRLAYYQISTTSIHNIVSLTDQLEYVREQVAKLTGEARIAGVPFILRRVEKTISAPKTDRHGNPTGRQRVKKFFLELEIEPEWIARMVRGISRLADPLRGVAALPAPLAVPAEAESLPVASMPASHYSEPPRWEPCPDDDDAIEGEFADEEPPAESTEAETKPTPPAQHPDRPYSPEQLRDKVRAFIAACKAKNVYHDPETGDPHPVEMHPFGKRTPQLIAAKIQEALKGVAGVKPEEAYHVVLGYFFFNTQSANDLKAVEAAALLKILFNGNSGEVDFKSEVLAVAKDEMLAVYYKAAPAAQDEIQF